MAGWLGNRSIFGWRLLKMKNRSFMFRLSVLGLIGVILATALVLAFLDDDENPVRISTTAPDFMLPKVGGETVTLSDYQGQAVFINFWASWCGPCREEMPYMQRQYELKKNEGVEILAVNMAESESVASSFAEQMGVSFPILLDEDLAVARQYRVGALPSSFFIDEHGIVVHHVEGMLTEQQISEYMESIQP
jgi:peroxiredoxin